MSCWYFQDDVNCAGDVSQYEECDSDQWGWEQISFCVFQDYACDVGFSGCWDCM